MAILYRMADALEKSMIDLGFSHMADTARPLDEA